MNNLKLNNTYYGGHISIKYGILNALDEIIELGGNMIQIFISNPMSIRDVNYNDKFTSKYISDIINKLKNTNTKIVIHLPYVINLAKPLSNKYNWWIDMICKQLEISEKIKSIGCVVHVGKYKELTESEGLDNMYKALKIIINFLKINKMKTHIILETAAGQGTELIPTKNNDISDFANFYNRFDTKEKKHLKICIDTCHIFSAGYNLNTKESVKKFFNIFNKLIGIKHIDLIHLNDSKIKCGGCVDRHANLGEGYINLEAIKHFIKYALFYNIPLILETPGEYKYELKLIKNIEKKINNWIGNL